MKHTDFDNIVQAQCERLLLTNQKARKEYAHGEVEDVFNNFNRVGGHLKIDRKKVLWIYLQKHLDGILAHINGLEEQREPIEGRITDAQVYLMLLLGMIKEDKNPVVAEYKTPREKHNELMNEAIKKGQQDPHDEG